MCKHEMIKVNDVSVCKRCGLTLSADGKFLMFDKRLPNYKDKKKGRK